MKNWLKALSYILTAVIAASAAAAICSLTILPLPSEQTKQTKQEELKELIDTYFIGEYDPAVMDDFAATGMVAALGDRWSHYIPASEYSDYEQQMNNAYVGVGITVALREDGTGADVHQVEEDGPADIAGLRGGDIIIGVDGQSMEGMSLAEVSGMVKGPEGTTVELTVLRGDQRMEFTVERKAIKVKVAWGEMVTPEIGLIRIENFDARCATETINAIGKMLDSGAEALIFDVRNNPGGYKHEMVNVLDYLLPEGPLFRSVDYSGATQVDYSGPGCLEIPMAVVVNEESYSAAEFFAAALREYDAAVVVGQQTCGKGYFQSTFVLSDGSAVGLSIGKYITPNGVSLAESGLTPDQIVEVDEETFFDIYYGELEPEEDPQIQAAITLLNGE